MSIKKMLDEIKNDKRRDAGLGDLFITAGEQERIIALEAELASANEAIDAVINRLDDLAINTDCYLELLAFRRKYPKKEE